MLPLDGPARPLPELRALIGCCPGPGHPGVRHAGHPVGYPHTLHVPG